MQPTWQDRLVREHIGELVTTVRDVSHVLEVSEDFDPLLDAIGDARFVLIGEASHGTSEFYTWRARLTQRLIDEKNFDFVAVEGDWPDCYRLNRYVKSYRDSGDSALDVLFGNERWPTWMWSNWEVIAFAEWLRRHNRETGSSVGFYGLDVYSLWESMEAIIRYLEKNDPDAVAAARRAYECFQPYEKDVQQYAASTMVVPKTCEREVVDLLQTIRARAPMYDGDPEAAFNTEQNALVLRNAEHYYRTMVGGSEDSWNVRDSHMSETLDRLAAQHGPGSRAVVWEHNTHVGDARATDMASAGMVNVGQLVRESHEDDGVVLVGFGSYEGTVMAARQWGASMQAMPVPEARAESWEDVFHRAGGGHRYVLSDDLRLSELASAWRHHRAIGVVYHPRSERIGNYVPTILPERYDAFIHIDHTMALHPLHIHPITGRDEPETYPWGM